MRTMTIVFALVLMMSISTAFAADGDWLRFRGPNGFGAADIDVPLTWSDTENVRWKAELPGPGASSPVILGDRVFLTAYSGYGLSKEDLGEIEDLKRHLLCIDRKTGETIWQKTLDAVQPEDPYRGAGVPEHGYASHTPTTDGENVYFFLGKSGVHAYTIDGEKLWSADVGQGSDKVKWSSAASPVLYEDLLIVIASDEGKTVWAFDKATGDVRWKYESDKLSTLYGTPAFVEVDGRTEMVFGVSQELWGFDPATGQRLWWVATPNNGAVSTSPIVDDGIIYFSCQGLRGSGTVAVRPGGRGDVTETHVIYSVSESCGISTPVLVDGRLYLVKSQAIAICLDAKTGEVIFEEELPTPNGERPKERMWRYYGSPVVAGDKIILPSRYEGIKVLAPTAEFKILATNHFGDDTSTVNSTPSLGPEEMLIRTDKALYCIEAVK